jgi:hypothetical protein
VSFRPIEFTFDAHSGPSGQSPSGSAEWIDRTDLFGGSVTCLTVTGNRATIGFANQRGALTDIVKGGFLFVEDNGMPGAGQDNVRGQLLFDAPPTVCPTNTVVYRPGPDGDTVTQGELTVNDALPLSRHRARQACIFERVAHGITVFRAKYGLGPSHDHAMRHCVRLYTGF